MDRVQFLKTYLRVAELRSFTRAAESLGLPKASVSAQIQDLENEMGTRLLHRTTRSVQLTHDGMAFYERSKDLLADLEELQTMFQEGDAGLSGRIRVDMATRSARLLVIPNLHKFLARHPRIEIELGSTDREVDLVREGYDCVIRGGDLEDSNLISKKICEVEHVNCVSPSYIKKHGRPKSIADLKNHLLVHYVTTFGEKPEGFEYRDGGGYVSVPMRGVITVNNAESYVTACANGLGIIQSPRGTLEKDLRNKTLIEVLPDFKAAPMPIYFVYPHQRNLPRRVRAFMDWVETLFKK